MIFRTSCGEDKTYKTKLTNEFLCSNFGLFSEVDFLNVFLILIGNSIYNQFAFIHSFYYHQLWNDIHQQKQKDESSNQIYSQLNNDDIFFNENINQHLCLLESQFLFEIPKEKKSLNRVKFVRRMR